MNLHGLRVLNTRPLAQAEALSKAISNAGGVSIEFPALTIKPTTDDWLKNLPSLTQVKQAIFISANAVNFFFKKLKQQQITWPTVIQIIAIGKATAAALAAWHLPVTYVPPIADSEHLLRLDLLKKVRNQTILLVKGEEGKKEIAATLKARGAHLISLDVYRRALPSIKPQQIYSLWQDDLVDIILFTSQQAMQNLFILFGDQAKPWLCKKPCVVISARLAAAAKAFGIQTIILSRHDTILSSLQEYICQKLKKE